MAAPLRGGSGAPGPSSSIAGSKASCGSCFHRRPVPVRLLEEEEVPLGPLEPHSSRWIMRTPPCGAVRPFTTSAMAAAASPVCPVAGASEAAATAAAGGGPSGPARTGWGAESGCPSAAGAVSPLLVAMTAVAPGGRELGRAAAPAAPPLPAATACCPEGQPPVAMAGGPSRSSQRAPCSTSDAAEGSTTPLPGFGCGSAPVGGLLASGNPRRGFSPWPSSCDAATMSFSSCSSTFSTKSGCACMSLTAVWTPTSPEEWTALMMEATCCSRPWGTGVPSTPPPFSPTFAADGAMLEASAAEEASGGRCLASLPPPW
mmetsp:Transcript_21377/g.59319  ORF Transcript_21377/g.59319 Transcript_21377/m.59319 type:complete len:316 (+) Transcript_21377:99-1046(+)